jgi:hypothetical protein
MSVSLLLSVCKGGSILSCLLLDQECSSTLSVTLPWSFFGIRPLINPQSR